MGFLGNIITKGVVAAARNSTIKAVGEAAGNVIMAASRGGSQKEDSVVKNGILYIKPTRASECYIGENALDVVGELLGVGFEGVTLRSVKKLSERSVKKYGTVSSIEINGESDFRGVKKIPSTSHILIKYLDFKKDVDCNIYANVKKLKNGIIHEVAELENSLPRIESSNTEASSVEIAKKYCPYCGEKVLAENAKFCSNCGKEI